MLAANLTSECRLLDPQFEDASCSSIEGLTLISNVSVTFELLLLLLDQVGAEMVDKYYVWE